MTNQQSQTGLSTSGSGPAERQIAFRAISDLKPHPRNARKHSGSQIKAIAKSIEAFGFNAPVLVDGDGNILAGHGRVEAAKLLDVTRCAVPPVPRPPVFPHNSPGVEPGEHIHRAKTNIGDGGNWQGIDDPATARSRNKSTFPPLDSQSAESCGHE
jgi:hypothetical protein